MNDKNSRKLCGLVALLLPVAAQCAGVTIGGTVDLALRRVKNGSLGTLLSEASGANGTSKLVISGSEDLGGGNSAGFTLDGTILADTGGAGIGGKIFDRRTTVSLANQRFGELRLGRDWAPTHLVWSGFDPFATLGIAGANTFRSFGAARVLNQAFGPTAEAVTANATLRVSNAVEYFLPAGLGGVYGQLIATARENGAAAEGFTRGEGFRVGWAGAGFNVAAAQFTTRNANNERRFQDQVVGVSYDFGVAKVALAQRRWVFRPERMVNTMVAAQVPLGAGVLKLSWQRGDQKGAADDNDATLVGAGYVYGFSKRTAAYVHAARVRNQGKAAFAVLGGGAVSANPAAPNYFGGQTSSGFELGLRHDF